MEPLGTRQGLRLSWRPGEFTVHSANHVVARAEGACAGGVYGLLTREESCSLISQLATCDDPGKGLPEVPWAVAVERLDGSVAISCSPMLGAGMFWSLGTQASGANHLVIATDPAWVVRNRHRKTSLDDDYIANWLLGDTLVETTPYREVHRVPTGETFVWREANRRPAVVQWCGPAVWPEPTLTLRDARSEYLLAFDTVVADLMSRTGPLAAAVSGGLDSTFLAASLALQTTRERPVHGFVAAPLVGATTTARRGWEPDDTPYARLLADRYPGRMSVTPVRNEQGVQPLDSAHEAARLRWLPTRNVANHVWYSQINELATLLGARLVFTGEFGNHSFSFPGTYRGWLRRFAVLGRQRLRHAYPGAMKHGRSPSIAAVLGLNESKVRRPWAADSPGGLRARLASFKVMGAAVPIGGQALIADPFRSPSILSLAAQLRPDTWRAHDVARGFARDLGCGRVPDAIRLRTTRGLQASDVWEWIKFERGRYLGEIELLAETDVVGEIIDVQQLAARVASWPWGRSAVVDPLALTAVHRALSLADFVRMTQRRLQEL